MIQWYLQIFCIPVMISAYRHRCECHAKTDKAILQVLSSNPLRVLRAESWLFSFLLTLAALVIPSWFLTFSAIYMVMIIPLFCALLLPLNFLCNITEKMSCGRHKPPTHPHWTSEHFQMCSSQSFPKYWQFHSSRLSDHKLIANTHHVFMSCILSWILCVRLFHRRLNGVGGWRPALINTSLAISGTHHHPSPFSAVHSCKHRPHLQSSSPERCSHCCIIFACLLYIPGGVRRAQVSLQSLCSKVTL